MRVAMNGARGKGRKEMVVTKQMLLAAAAGFALAAHMPGAMAEDTLKVGLMVPANNTTMQVELPKWLPEGSQVTTVKIPRGPGMLTSPR